MYSMWKTDVKAGQNKFKIAALFFLIFLIICSYSAEVLIIANMHHECAGAGCPVCEKLQKVRALDALIDEIMASAIVVFILSAILFTAAATPVKKILIVGKSATLVGKMVRMNN